LNAKFNLVLLLFCAVVCFAKDDSVEALKSRVDGAPAQERPSLCVQIAQAQLRNVDELYTQGHIDEALDALHDIVVYSEKGRDAAKESRKDLKKVEIAVRKIADRLADIKRSLAFDDQAPVEAAIQHLQDIRTSLLQEMFKKERK